MQDTCIKESVEFKCLFLDNKIPSIHQYGRLSNLTKGTRDHLQHVCPELLLNCLNTTHWVTINGIKFNIGDILTVGLIQGTGLPTYGKILNILVTEHSNIYFLSSLFHTSYFDEHVYAYRVETTDDTLVLQSGDIFAPCPNMLTVTPFFKMLYNDGQFIKSLINYQKKKLS